jgi:hypothetical protein
MRMLLNESTYSKKVRPSHKVMVDIRFLFNQIISMVEKEQIIVTNCFVDQKWTGSIKKKEEIEINSISRSTSSMESIRISEYHLDSNACYICLVKFIFLKNSFFEKKPNKLFRYPDTFLYNTADNAGFLLPQDSQNVMVNSNGTVFWPLPLAQLRTRCRMTIKHFPFGKEFIFQKHCITSRKFLLSL